MDASSSSSPNRARSRLWIRIAAAAAVAIAATVVVVAGLRRGPLTGPRHHDYGTVWIEGKDAVARHVFHLVNRSTRPVTIEQVRPSCGCTSAEPSVRDVGPGEAVDLAVALTLSVTGRKKADVKLLLDHDGEPSVRVLTVEAMGRRAQTLTVSTRRLQVAPGGRATVTVFSEVLEHDDAPPALNLAVPVGCEASFGGWKKGTGRDRRSGKPARWSGSLTISREPDAPGDVDLVVGQPTLTQQVTITLVDPAPETR